MNPQLPEAETRSLFCWLAIAALIWTAVAMLTGCTLRINADGSKDATVDAPTILRAIEVIAEK
jgi:hypothetical protein